jgi:hypothetical protein
MNIPPTLLRIKFADEKHKFSLWLPLVLLAPFVLLFLAILLPFYVVAILVLWPWGWGKSLLLAPLAIYRVVCGLRGLKVDVQSRKADKIYISFA